MCSVQTAEVPLELLTSGLVSCPQGQPVVSRAPSCPSGWLQLTRRLAQPSSSLGGSNGKGVMTLMSHCGAWLSVTQTGSQ